MGRVQDVVQTLTCRYEIIVPIKKLTMLTTGFGLDLVLTRADWITLLTTEFDSIGDHVKKDKCGACKHKAATVLPSRTAATQYIYSSLSSFEFDIVW